MKFSKKIQLQIINFFKNQKKNQAKEAMQLWAECTKARAKYQCEFCGKKENLNAHHIFSRSRNSTRYSLENSICLCSGCHSLSIHSAHKDPLFLTKLIERGIRTEQWLVLLERQASIPQKIDLKMELIYLKQTLDKLKNGD